MGIATYVKDPPSKTPSTRKATGPVETETPQVMSHNIVLVTGANGYIASHVIALLISRGYKVRGAVRSESSGGKLRERYADRGDQFSLTIVPDITKPEAYADAFDGVTGVIRT